MTEKIFNSEYLNRIDAAMALRRIPDYDAALQQIQRAIALAPNSAEAYVLLALTYQDLQRWDEAEEHLQRALSLNPDSREIKQALGLMLVQRLRYSEALEYLSWVAEEEVHDRKALLAYVTALSRTGKYDEAVSKLRHAYHHLNQDAEIGSRLGNLLIRNEQFDEAIEILHKVQESNPSATVLCDLADAYFGKGKLDSGVQSLERALKLQPNYDRAWRELASAYLRQNRADRALECADKAMAIDDSEPLNWMTKLQVLLDRKENSQAEALVGSGIEKVKQGRLNKDFADVLVQFRILLAVANHGIDKAVQVVSAIPNEDRSPGILRLTKDLLLRGGRFEEAIVAIKEYEARAATRDDVAFSYFWAYHGLGDPEKATEFLSEGLRLQSSKSLDVLDGIAQYLYNEELYEFAANVLTQAVEALPTWAEGMNNLGFILAGESNWERAESLFIRSLESGYMQPWIPLINLAYIYIRQHEYELAITKLDEAATQVNAEKAILRVAYWYRGSFSDCKEDRFPTRATSVALSISANKAISLLRLGRIGEAYEEARRLVEDYPNDSIGYRVLGCLYLDQGDLDNAKLSFERASKSSASKKESRVIERWLHELKATRPM